jgi:hypothetical protein
VIEYCKKCGKPLFETTGNSRKIFGSFTTKLDKETGKEYYLCYNCYVNKDVKEERKEENGED